MPEDVDTTNRVAILSGQNAVGDLPRPQQQEITIGHRPHVSIDISPGQHVVGDQLQPQQQEITLDSPHHISTAMPSGQQEVTTDDRVHMPIDELMKLINGLNGASVFYVPSGDGRPAMVPVRGRRRLVPASASRNSSRSTEKKQKDLRNWLLLLSSLAATVTFTAGLTPPGGFWTGPDEANGYVAGTSVMRDRFPHRYYIFKYSNTTAFFSSLLIIATIAKNMKAKTVARDLVLVMLVGTCIVSLGISYITGTWDDHFGAIPGIVGLVGVCIHVSLAWFRDSIALILVKRRPRSQRPVA